MKLFLDTNVLIDLFGQREPFFQSALTLQLAEAFRDVELWASAKSFTDVFYVLNRDFESETIQDAFATSAEFLHVCSVDGNDVLSTCALKWPDFEDALVYTAAQKVDADYLVTRDIQGFSQGSLPCKTPQEIVGLLSEQGLSYEEISW